MRVIFMGTPDFAVPVLDALHGAGHDLAAVYSRPPRPAGRGKRPRPPPVHARAEALGLEVRTPRSLRGTEEHAAFAALGAEVAVVAAYGLILPRPVLDAPARGCLNVHASLLPRWRGAAPIHRAVMAGDRETGVCVMGMEEGLDTGSVFLRTATPIGDTDTTGELHDRLAAMGAALMVDALARLDDLAPEPQPEEGVTYASKIDKPEAAVDWTRPAAALARHVNGLSPFPGAYVERGGVERTGGRLKLMRARAVEGSAPPGVVDGAEGLVVGTGAGRLSVLEVQPAGRGRIDAAAWRRGAGLAAGERL